MLIMPFRIDALKDWAARTAVPSEAAKCVTAGAALRNPFLQAYPISASSRAPASEVRLLQNQNRTRIQRIILAPATPDSDPMNYSGLACAHRAASEAGY